TYIDFLGTKAGIRLQYGGDFKIYSTLNGGLVEISPKYRPTNHFQNEIDAFINCVQTRETLPSHIDKAILTSKIMQALYDSSDLDREVML
ncbi:MAG: gfo/Idh/MocA family oxidoreductase, partial [Clostridiales bacterium]|nr:gfo/Idh/MocA family oxidoreductase [Clostridiales bacterium]